MIIISLKSSKNRIKLKKFKLKNLISKKFSEVRLSKIEKKKNYQNNENSDPMYFT